MRNSIGLKGMRFFGVTLVIFSEFDGQFVNLTTLFTSMTEYAAVDLRGLRRNAASKVSVDIWE